MVGKQKVKDKNSINTFRKSSNIDHLARDIINSAGVGIYIVQDGKFVYVSPLYQNLTGYSEGEILGRNSLDYLHPDDRELTRVRAISSLKGEISEPYEYRFIRKNGAVIWVLERVTSIMYAGERSALGSFMDITERKQMEEKIRQSEERYRTILDEMEEWYFETDIKGNITFFNNIFFQVLGYSPKKLIGLNFRAIVRPEEVQTVYKTFNKVFETGEPARNFPYEFIHSDGGVTFVEFSIFPRRSREGAIIGFRGVGRDITARRQAAERIEYLATHDALTDLPNRLMFSQMLKRAILSANRYQRKFAILFIDLDRFKIINDTLGHEAGDQLLREIAIRFKQELRAVDVVSRLGGDEFVILVEEASDVSQLSVIAQRIISATLKPVVISGQECRVTASIGVCIFPDDADNEHDLMKNADTAMYFAKERGKNNYQFYSRSIQAQSIERLAIETNLRHALEKKEFFLHYQAKLDYKTGVITGVEALLRWHSHKLGLVSPLRFLNVAEETALIVPIGRWVLEEACLQNVAWQRQGLPEVCICVNLSLRQLLDCNLIEDVSAALAKSGMAPYLLELELTESMIMHNPAHIIDIMAKIKKLGVRLAIDNFGTGYLSLAQIKDFTVDTLKVDRSFIRTLPENAEGRAITEAIIGMGKSLSLTVVAEGVETKEQNDFLREHACDEMQGFYFSKPTPPEEFSRLLRQRMSAEEK